MMNIKVILIIILSLSLISCGSKTKTKEIDLGMTLVNRTVDYLLKGKQNMASYSYNRSITKFRDMGNFCNMSRTAIMVVTLDPEGSLPLLEEARAFAVLGLCQNELNIINYLSKNEFDPATLEEPYKTFLKFEESGDIAPLIILAGKKKTSDKIKSLSYRKAAAHILEENPVKAMELIEKAIEIDSKNAWTLNLIKNEKIKKQALEAVGKATDISEQKIRILEQALDEKY